MNQGGSGLIFSSAVLYPMTATNRMRWLAILTQLACLQVLACQDTKYTVNPFQHDEPVHRENIHNFLIYHWHHGPVCKALINIDNHLRYVEDILEEGINADADITEIRQVLQFGAAYDKMVKKEGKGHKRGPAHIWIFGEMGKLVAATPNSPEDREILEEFAANHEDVKKMEKAVPFSLFTSCMVKTKSVFKFT